jgi:hypothetical protein
LEPVMFSLSQNQWMFRNGEDNSYKINTGP